VVKEKKETTYNVYIRYRDGGVDKFYGVKSAGANDNVLEIVDGNGILIGITLGVVSYYNVEKS